MKKRKVNLDYLNLYQEIPLFCILEIGALFRKKAREKIGRTLIVNTCLIGEFAASIPAVSDYIKRNNAGVVDLMVSPPLKSLAERILGVGNVYVARSLYGRHNELVESVEQVFPEYDEILVMRVSREAFRIIRRISAGKLSTGLKQYSGYGVHLWWNVLTRKLPKQWIELNFEMLGGKIRPVPFDDMFQFTQSELMAVDGLEELHTKEKKVLIHTGAGWIMKKWELDKWIKLIRKIHELNNARFIFVGEGEDDLHDFNAIAAELDFPIYSLIGKIDLLSLLIVFRRSDYIIGTDSGPINMSHLADTRSLTILGPGPHFYMPWDRRDVVIDKSRGRGSYQMFFTKKNGFIDQITADEVYETFRNSIWKS